MSTWVFLAQMTQDNTDLREIVKAIILPAPNKKGHPTFLGKPYDDVCYSSTYFSSSKSGISSVSLILVYVYVSGESSSRVSMSFLPFNDNVLLRHSTEPPFVSKSIFINIPSSSVFNADMHYLCATKTK